MLAERLRACDKASACCRLWRWWLWMLANTGTEVNSDRMHTAEFEFKRVMCGKVTDLSIAPIVGCFFRCFQRELELRAVIEKATTELKNNSERRKVSKDAIAGYCCGATELCGFSR